MSSPGQADWSTLSTINSEFKELLKSLPPNYQFVTESSTIESIRAAGALQPPTEKWLNVLEKDVTIPVRDGHRNRARIYSPSEAVPRGPLLVMVHGGGFCVGQLEQEEDNCRNWVVDHGGVAVSIQHRRAPEFPFPVPIYDAYDALKWIASHADELEADPAKGFVMGGTSSGAAATTIASHLYRDNALSPPLTGLLLSMPGFCMQDALPERYASDPRVVSWQQNANVPIIGAAALELFTNAYNSPPDSPLRSPLLWPSGHAGLPRTYFQIAGMDPLRDFGFIYEEDIRNYGVETKVDVFPGLVHGFWSFFPEAEFSKDFTEKSRDGFRWLLAAGGEERQ